MERKILFKAKRLDTKEWIQGFIVPNRMGEGMSIEVFNFKNEWCGAYFVDPSTICQFTGAKDANGTMLYEHDVIHFKGYEPTAEIKWVDDAYAFMVEYDGNLDYLSTVLDIGKVEIVRSAFDKEVDDESDL